MIIRKLNVFARRVLTTLAIAGAGVGMIPVVANAAPAADQQPAQSPIEAVGAEIATAVDARDPVGAGVSFDASVGGVYAWVKLKNKGEATTITMLWKKDGHLRQKVELAVGHSWGWKTWSKKTITAKSIGHWDVEVVDASGLPITSLSFDIKAGNVDVGVK